jgi:hypothetical protein
MPAMGRAKVRQAFGPGSMTQEICKFKPEKV